jgi:5-methylthioadenosine/S-adenosylhomocysteine deaminase
MYRLHAEEALTAAELEAAAAAHARGERIVMHAAETRHRLDLVTAAFGLTTVRLLDHYGLLSERMLLSHAVHVDAEEQDLLARTHTCVVASPAAEMKLADGIAPIADYIAAGMTVALGTDSAVCNNGNDMFLECRQLGLTQKLARGADALPADRILRCATADGARALGGADRFGAIARGLSADIVLVDTSSPRLQPLLHREAFTNVAANLVYAATAQDVTDVMVRGHWCVRDRRLTVADQDRLWDELARAAATLHDRID